MERRTERLVLREWGLGDLAAVQAFAGDPEVVRYMAWGPNTIQDSTEFLAETLADAVAEERVKWEFAVEAGGEVIGTTGLWITSHENRAGMFGYVLRRGAWGHGYATEAARAMLRVGFDVVGLHRIGATCRPENEASAGVLRKAGLRYEGRLRDHQLIRGTWSDSLLFAVLATDLEEPL